MRRPAKAGGYALANTVDEKSRRSERHAPKIALKNPRRDFAPLTSSAKPRRIVLRCRILALSEPRKVSGLSPESVPKRTLIGSLSPLAIL